MDHVELAMLRERLREQQRATLRAMHTAFELQNQLTSARAEVENIERKYRDRRHSPVVLAAARHRESQPGNLRRAMIALAVMATAGFAFWGVSTPPDAPAPVISPPPHIVDQVTALDSSAAFGEALSALDNALAAFPGRIPEDVLREAAQKDQACLLRWNNGHPSFVFEPQATRGNSLSLAIARCAEAVRLLHPG